jgi:hypothetical protein
MKKRMVESSVLFFSILKWISLAAGLSPQPVSR